MAQTVKRVSLARENPIGPGHGLASVTDKISDLVLRRPIGLGWVLGLLTALGLLGALHAAIGWLLYRGTGIWGINIPVGWGFAIVNFVWWGILAGKLSAKCHPQSAGLRARRLCATG